MNVTSLCLYCGATNIPQVLNAEGKFVSVEHDDEAHDNRPCQGSGK